MLCIDILVFDLPQNISNVTMVDVAWNNTV
jgi:hypothetical protein